MHRAQSWAHSIFTGTPIPRNPMPCSIILLDLDALNLCAARSMMLHLGEPMLIQVALRCRRAGESIAGGTLPSLLGSIRRSGTQSTYTRIRSHDCREHSVDPCNACTGDSLGLHRLCLVCRAAHGSVQETSASVAVSARHWYSSLVKLSSKCRNKIDVNCS